MRKEGPEVLYRGALRLVLEALTVTPKEQGTMLNSTGERAQSRSPGYTGSYIHVGDRAVLLGVIGKFIESYSTVWNYVDTCGIVWKSSEHCGTLQKVSYKSGSPPCGHFPIRKALRPSRSGSQSVTLFLLCFKYTWVLQYLGYMLPVSVVLLMQMKHEVK